VQFAMWAAVYALFAVALVGRRHAMRR
jgi:hypothetical protein